MEKFVKVRTLPNDGLLRTSRYESPKENACFFLAVAEGVERVLDPLEIVRESRYRDLGRPISDEDPEHLRVIRRVSLILNIAIFTYHGRHLSRGLWEIDLRPFMVISPPQIVQRRGDIPKIVRLVTDGTHFELIRNSDRIFTLDPPPEKWKEIERKYREILSECVYSDEDRKKEEVRRERARSPVRRVERDQSPVRRVERARSPVKRVERDRSPVRRTEMDRRPIRRGESPLRIVRGREIIPRRDQDKFW